MVDFQKCNNFRIIELQNRRIGRRHPRVLELFFLDPGRNKPREVKKMPRIEIIKDGKVVGSIGTDHYVVIDKDGEFKFANYTEPELHAAFDRVADPDDWRAPINAIVPEEELPVTLAAIEFFTATKGKAEPSKWEVVPPEGEVKKCVRVTAAGYRNGPAGP